MTFEEIKNILEITGKEAPVFMPNEIFEELQGYLVDSSHLAYAYSYMYLVHFLYRNCKYFNVKTLLDGNIIKQILGYSKSNRTMNYITKKEGLLDKIKYTSSTKNYPVSWEFEEGSGEELEFIMYDDMGDMKDVLPPIPKMFFLKYPKKAFEDRDIERTYYSKEGKKIIEVAEVWGTFYDIEQTTTVDFNVFMFCMGKRDLGVIAFYLYSWIKLNCDIHHGRYDAPIAKLVKVTGMSRTTVLDYMDLLKGYRMIYFQHNMEYFVLGAFKEDRLANSYFINKYEFFSDIKLDYERMEYQPYLEYVETKAREENARRNMYPRDRKKGIVPISELPF